MCTAYVHMNFSGSTHENLSSACTIKTSQLAVHNTSAKSCVPGHCLWYLFTASLSCGTLINIIMQNKESDNIDKKTVSSSRS